MRKNVVTYKALQPDVLDHLRTHFEVAAFERIDLTPGSGFANA